METDLYEFPDETIVYVPLLPKAKLSDSIKAVNRLASVRLAAIPHLAARNMPSTGATDEWLAELSSMGCNRLMLVAGDGGGNGPYKDTLDVLGSGLLEKYGFSNIGVAGHPDGHVHAADSRVRAALEIKNSYAIEHKINMWIVTQFFLDMESFSHWLDDWEEYFGNLPVHIGLAGRVSIHTLVKYAIRCGIVTSARFMAQNPRFGRSPESMLEDYRLYCGHRPRVRGLHLFPFGDTAAAAKWVGRNESKI